MRRWRVLKHRVAGVAIFALLLALNPFSKQSWRGPILLATAHAQSQSDCPYGGVPEPEWAKYNGGPVCFIAEISEEDCAAIPTGGPTFKSRTECIYNAGPKKASHDVPNQPPQQIVDQPAQQTNDQPTPTPLDQLNQINAQIEVLSPQMGSEDAQAETLAGQLRQSSPDQTSGGSSDSNQTTAQDQPPPSHACSPNPWSQPSQSQSGNLEATISYVADYATVKLINNSNNERFQIVSIQLSNCAGIQSLIYGSCLNGGATTINAGFVMYPHNQAATNANPGPGDADVNGCYPPASYTYTVTAINLTRGGKVTVVGSASWQPMSMTPATGS